MKKYFVSLLLVACLALPAVVLAAGRFQAADQVLLGADQTQVGNFYASGQSVIIAGQVTSDLYVAGNNIEISGIVDGDVIAAGNNIKISGQVKGNVRVVGSTIEVSGTVDRNLAFMGEMVSVTDKAKIGGELSGMAGRLNVFGPVGGNVEGFYRNLLLASSVGRDVEVTVGDNTNQSLEILPSVTIAGDLNYRADKEVVIPSGASINGQTNFILLNFDKQKKSVRDFQNTAWWFSKVFYFFSLLVVGLVILTMTKKKSWQTVKIMNSSLGKSLLIGLLWLIITPFAVGILMMTIIGLPLALIILAVYLFSFYLFAIWTSLYLGKLLCDRLLKKKNISSHWQLVIGTLAFVIIVSIPFIGGLLYFLFMLWTWGALYQVKKLTIKEWQ